ncbi:NADPH:quinone oxidoreductase family protein [Pseudoxanthomonas sacheonensis]|uniref:NADPH:quinone oxidoreductase family protein n=1 Tax=Pseudoxanthomonas sacheonensis TaxID=443615 RepID=UPI0013D0C035|nr:NADPH:quinone oxidoreductase family protein [Pseudoxanthomonas sacheonensis]KAF1707772.1 NADPH:quinone oxidoreductase [Pseudoxanthomonas sacheonensis]
MKAIVCESWGPPSSLQLRDLPSPIPGPAQVLVRTRVAAVNFPDALMVAGKYQFKPGLPFSPGGELSGEIIAVGSEVKRLAVGNKVVGITLFGAYAQEVVVDASNILPLPDEIGDEDLELAGSFVLTYGTSLHALKDRAQAKAGETLLVLGAGGGVGLAAVEIGKLLGMRVIAAASSAEKLAAARERGADEAIDYASEDLRERIKVLTGGRGVDVVYDPVGGDLAEPALRSVGWRGRYLVVGFAAGDIPKIPANLLLLKGSSLVGVFWGEFVRREPALNAENMGLLFSWLRERRIHPLISRRYPLSQASDALDALLARKAVGKLVVLPQQVE